MKKILHIVGSSMSRAGMETFIMNIYRQIDKSKYQFGFLVHSHKKGDFDDEIYSMGGEIHRVIPDSTKAYPTRVLKRFFNTYKFLKNNSEYSVIHIHTSAATSIVELLASYLAGCKIRIIHSHNTNTKKSRSHKLLYRLMQIFSTHRFACSELAGIWMFGKNFNNIKNSKVINNGIDTDVFYYDTNKQKEIKRRLDLENKLVVGHIGRFSKVKNHDFIIDIFNYVHKLNKEAILILIGDGELRLEIENKVKDQNLSNKVIFTGVREDINELLLGMDIMLFPSFHEGLPVTLVEAQATGLKILASDAVSKEANLTGLVKYVSLEKAAFEWAQILIEEANYLRENQKDSIKESKYDIGGIVNELCNIYEEKSDTQEGY